MDESVALTLAVWEWVVGDLTKTRAHKDLNKTLMAECIKCGVGDLTKTGCRTGSERDPKMKLLKKLWSLLLRETALRQCFPRSRAESTCFTRMYYNNGVSLTGHYFIILAPKMAFLVATFVALRTEKRVP